MLGPSYTLHTPQAINTALRRGIYATRNPVWSSPFYLLLPMNMQSSVIPDCNLLAFPQREPGAPAVCGDQGTFERVIAAIGRFDKTVIKIGGGAKNLNAELIELADRTDAVVVSGPQAPGVFPYNNQRNMTVGGSKGSISGNYAMNEADLVIIIGARSVCQWDCSGVAWKNARQFINFNTNAQDALHYNRTIPVVGGAQSNLQILLEKLRESGVNKSKGSPSAWLTACLEKRADWEQYRNRRYEKERLYDEVFGKEVLTQPAAIKIACDFAKKIGAVKYFDAGDVQANGFQIVEDETPSQTFTDTGASYMGFGVSSLLASALAEEPRYGIAFAGEGSFLMNPQILMDAVQHRYTG